MITPRNIERFSGELSANLPAVEGPLSPRRHFPIHGETELPVSAKSELNFVNTACLRECRSCL